MTERPSYSVLEQKYLRVFTAYTNLKERYENLKRRAESYKDDAMNEKRVRIDTEREFRGYLGAGQNSLKSYREIIKMCSGRFRGIKDEEFADRLDNYLNNMQERVQPVADMEVIVKELERLTGIMIEKHGYVMEYTRPILREIRGYDRWEDVSPLPVAADDGEAEDRPPV